MESPLQAAANVWGHTSPGRGTVTVDMNQNINGGVKHDASSRHHGIVVSCEAVPAESVRGRAVEKVVEERVAVGRETVGALVKLTCEHLRAAGVTESEACDGIRHSRWKADGEKREAVRGTQVPRYREGSFVQLFVEKSARTGQSSGVSCSRDESHTADDREGDEWSSAGNSFGRIRPFVATDADVARHPVADSGDAITEQEL